MISSKIIKHRTKLVSEQSWSKPLSSTLREISVIDIFVPYHHRVIGVDRTQKEIFFELLYIIL